MDADGLDGLVASTLENVFYLSGVWHLGAELFPRDSEGYVVATRDDPEHGGVVISVGEADLLLEADPADRPSFHYGTFYREMPPEGSGIELDADERAIWERTIDRPGNASPFDALVAAIESAGLASGRIGVDERGPNRDLLDKLRDRLPGLEIVPAAQIFRRIRMVKTPIEQERLIGAMAATEHAFRVTLDAVHEGVTEAELAHVFECGITEAGARPGFTLIRFGKGMALGQVSPGDTKLVKGDYLWFDIGCSFRGYKSDIGRIVSYGEPSEKLRSLNAASKAGQDRAIELMTPGRVASDVFNEAVARVRECGIPDYRRHHVGHGIGIEYYDLPILTPSSDIPLEAGMIFEVETPYYEFGFGGAFIEDTVLVGEDSASILTTLDRELQVIGD